MNFIKKILLIFITFLAIISLSTSFIGCPSKPTVEVTEEKNQPPKAVAGENLEIEAGDHATLNGGKSSDPDGDILTYIWHLGDGRKADGKYYSAKYDEIDVYTVVLIVSDGEYEDSDTITINVIPAKEVVSKEPAIKIVSVEGYNIETDSYYELYYDTFKANITDVDIGLKLEDIDVKEDTITVSTYLDKIFENSFPINDVLEYDNGVYYFAINYEDDYKEGNHKFIFKVNGQEVETVEFSVEPIEEEIAEETTEEVTEETTEEKKEVLTAPTIKLEIVEGPAYSQAGDNVCYYRVKARVTGSPSPTISFNKDDSNGAWGKNIAQVNLYKSGESFTLEATATNSQTTAKDSIKLSYTCQKSIPVLVINDTGGNLSISLSGPANYNFNIPSGQQNIYVIPGTYNYTAKGCGGVVESGTENLSSSGHEWKWWCN